MVRGRGALSDFVALFAAVLVGLISTAHADSHEGVGLVMTGGRVYTVVGSGWSASPLEAIVIGKDGNILFIGSDADAEGTRAAMPRRSPSAGRRCCRD